MEKPRVLVADDNEATCTLVTALLRREFSVEIANSGREAIERLKTREYAVVLLDLLMPVVDGYAVLEFLRAERPALLGKVVVVTASVTPHEMGRVREYGVGVITKPFEVDQFVATVKERAGGGEPNAEPRGPLLSAGMLLLLADLLRQRWI